MYTSLDGVRVGGQRVDADLHHAFREMELRKLRRRSGRKYEESSMWRSVWMLIFVALFITFGALTLSYTGRPKVEFAVDMFTGMSFTASLFLMATVLTLYVVKKAATVVRWGLLMLFVIVLALLIVTGQKEGTLSIFSSTCPDHSRFDNTECPDRKEPCYESAPPHRCLETVLDSDRLTLMIVLLIGEALILIWWVGFRYLYAGIVRRWIDTDLWWHVRPVDGEQNTLRYRNHPMARHEHVCDYRGQTHPTTRQPHGWGEWRDDSGHGESLKGYWNEGDPVGPFKSREFGSGYAFVAVRVGFVMCRDDPWNETWFRPRPGELQFGVASVECCTSGKFFLRFPVVRLVHGPLYGREVVEGWMKDIMSHMKHIGQNEAVQSIVITATQTNESRARLMVSGYEAGGDDTVITVRCGLQSSSGSVTSESAMDFTQVRDIPALQVEGWSSTREKEVLLFFPGYNTSLEASLQRFGQLLCLGDFPSHITPLCFSYPAGQIMSYFAAKNIGAQGPATVECFNQVLKQLGESGYTKVHVMAHSMGATTFCHAFPLVAEDNLAPLSEGGASGLRLATVVFLNPDYALDYFIQNFPQLRKYCDHICMYGDAGDGALMWSERLNRYPAEGRCSVGASIQSMGLRVLNMCTTPVHPHLSDELSLSRSPSARHQYLDMDVIDTTWMENNVHSLRHNYFNINREIVEDLRELVSTRKRAAHRNRLQHRMGNVYSFLVAPSCVVNP